MSIRIFHLAALLLGSVAALHAEEAASQTTNEVKEVPAYELKNRSVFPQTAENARAPFWPIGWVKRTVGKTAETAEPATPRLLLDEKDFKVTSILIGSGTTPSLAVINGRAYSEGEFLRMPRGSAVAGVRIRVQRISDGKVFLQNADQVVVASIQRPQLMERRSDEPLLDPNR